MRWIFYLDPARWRRRSIAGELHEANITFSDARRDAESLTWLSIKERKILGRRLYLARRRLAARANYIDTIHIRLTFVVTIALIPIAIESLSSINISSAPPSGSKQYLPKSYIFLGVIVLPAIIMPLTRVNSLKTWRRVPPQVRAPIGPFRRLRELASGTARVVWPPIILAYMLLYIDWRWSQLDQDAFLGGLAVVALMGVILAIPLAGEKIITLLAERRFPSRPFDKLLSDLHALIVQAKTLQGVWYRPDVSRFLVNRLEDIARTCERETWPRRRAPLVEVKLRYATRDDYLRIAIVIRDHKKLIVFARSQRDYESLMKSLNDGVRAILAEDRAALLSNAPESVAARRFITGWSLRNLLPSVLLISGAIALPFFAPFRSAGNATQELRLSLGVFGIIKLIPGQASIIEIFSSVFSRADSK